MNISTYSYLAATHTLHVQAFPPLNYGTEVQHTSRFLAGDGPLIAGLLAASGHHTTLYSNALAADTDGHAVRAYLEQWHVRHRPGPASAKTRVNTVVTDLSGNRTWFSGLAGIHQEMARLDLDQFAAADLCYLDCYEVLGEAPRRAVAAALTAGSETFVNLGGGPVPDWMPDVVRQRRLDVLQTNADENSTDQATALLDRLADLDIAELVIVTAGRNGATARSRDGATLAAPAVPVEVTQVQGAGAAFSAALIHAHTTSHSPKQALTIACTAASHWCTRQPSNQLPPLTELA